MSFSKTRTRIELTDILSDNWVIVQFHSLVDWQECQTTETIVAHCWSKVRLNEVQHTKRTLSYVHVVTGKVAKIFSTVRMFGNKVASQSARAPERLLSPYLTLPPLFPCSLVLTAWRGFAHAAGFAAARRCLLFLVQLLRHLAKHFRYRWWSVFTARRYTSAL